jgi:hypothetical protein
MPVLRVAAAAIFSGVNLFRHLSNPVDVPHRYQVDIDEVSKTFKKYSFIPKGCVKRLSKGKSCGHARLTKEEKAGMEKMKLIWLSFAFALVLQSSFANAFSLDPLILPTGQALEMRCHGAEIQCLRVCQKPDECIIPENECRSCAGTQSLKLKRTLDEVGISIFAGEAAPEEDLIQLLRERNFISIHAMTLYNYGSAFNSPQLQAQFKALCHEFPSDPSRPGMLIFKLEKDTKNIHSILGAICPDASSSQTSLYFLSARK